MERALYVRLEGETNKVSGSVLGKKVMWLHNYHAVLRRVAFLTADWSDKFKADEAAQHVANTLVSMCQSCSLKHIP